MLALALWSFGNVAELAATSLPVKLFWANLEYLGIATVPVLWFVFAVDYTGWGPRLGWRNLVFLSIIPAVTILLVWTNPLHGLMRQNVRLDTMGSFSIVAKDYGPWFWVHTAYSYLMLALSALALLRMMLLAPHLYRRQANILFAGVLVPWIGNAIYLLTPRSVLRMDITPVMFTVSGLFAAWGLLRHGLLDIVPAARHAVVESMDDGVIVLDAEDRVVDINPAAQRILGYASEEVLGQPASEALPVELLPSSGGLAERNGIELPAGGCCYDPLISPLRDRRGEVRGRLVVLRNITERKRAEEALREARDRLEQRVAERTNELTQANEALSAEIAERQRAEELLSTLNETLERRVAERTVVAENRLAQLRRLTSELTLAEQRERRRLAQVLHDHLQQLLVAARLQVTTMRFQVGESRHAKYLDQIDQLLEESVRASRSLTVELSPPVLYERGLGAGLLWLARWMEEQHGLRVQTSIDEAVVPQAEEVRVLLFQAARELLFNIVKHAGVRQADLVLEKADEGWMRLLIADRGAGFDPEAHEDGEMLHGGFGLFSIQERIEALGGHLSVASQPGQGTTVILLVPL